MSKQERSENKTIVDMIGKIALIIIHINTPATCSGQNVSNIILA